VQNWKEYRLIINDLGMGGGGGALTLFASTRRTGALRSIPLLTGEQ
jgi:hypothetical protein